MAPTLRPPSADEFKPLPWYSWDVRPAGVPLDEDEAGTALFLTGGRVDLAAAKLRVEPWRLKRAIGKSQWLRQLMRRWADAAR
jgi:hypothetical protein